MKDPVDGRRRALGRWQEPTASRARPAAPPLAPPQACEPLEPRLLMSADGAGNALADARPLTLGASAVYRDFVGAADRDDYLRFTLASSRVVTARLSGLTGDADLRLLDAAGGLIQASARSGVVAEGVAVALAAGTYYLRVSGVSDAELTLNVAAAARDWFGTYLRDADLAQQARQRAADAVLDRAEVIDLLRSAGADDRKVDATELADLRRLFASGGQLGMLDYVMVLGSRVVNSCVANALYLGQRLGNLAAGSSATHLGTLVDKWFYGTDHPLATSPDGRTTYAYRAAAGSLFVDGPALADIEQGYLGDCWFVAALGSIAQGQPQALERMFLDNGDGTFTVRFFNGQRADYVTVDRLLPTDSSGRLIFAGMGSPASDPGNELWAALAEKAYAQLNELRWIGRDGRNRYQSLSGGWMEPVYEQVLGVNAGTFRLSTAASLIAALSRGAMITLGSNARTSDGVVAGHAYVLQGYDPLTGTFRLYNPWAIRHVTLTWTQLKANYGYGAMV